MTFLRRVLTAQATLWAAFGFVVGVAPGWLLETVADQPTLTDDAWIRALGVIAVVLALLMVLVSQRLEDVWWWSWAFLITTAAVTTVTGLHLLFGERTGNSNWLWAIFAGVNGLFTVGMLFGLGRAAQEKPFA